MFAQSEMNDGSSHRVLPYYHNGARRGERRRAGRGLWYNGGMKALLSLLGLGALAVCGCVNQDIAARRSDIPWNQPSRAEATGSLPSSLVDQYD